MSSRVDILATVAGNRPDVSRPLPEIPAFDQAPPASLLGAFRESLLRMGGRYLEPASDVDVLELVRAKLEGSAVVCSAVPEISGTFALSANLSPRDLAGVDYSVVRASFAVAETGSVLLTEQELVVNTSAYLAQHLIVLLDPADIVLNLHHAYKRPEFRERRYATFHTGPSATADIEGVLIHGAQGVRSLTVAPVARRPSPGF